MNKMDELIIATTRKTLFDDEKLTFQGLVTDTDMIDVLVKNLAKEVVIIPRGIAEEDKDFKQHIPYGIIKRGEEVFVYKRLKGAGEQRLHEKTSIGVGGHMNMVEDAADYLDFLGENLLRELEEEVEFDREEVEVEFELLGLINDDSNEVGEVHIGILVLIEIPVGTDVQVRETEQLEGYFLTINELKQPQHFNTLENWSKIAVEVLEQGE